MGLSESTHVKITHCWKSHVAAQLCLEQDVGYVCSSVAVELHCKLPCCEIITRMKLTYYEHQQKAPNPCTPPPLKKQKNKQ